MVDKLRLSRSKNVTDFGTGIRGDLWVIEDENGRQVTTLWTDQVSEDIARLFAGAPELYAALWALLPQAIAAAGILETYGHDIAEMCVTFEQAAVAIGKAEGRDE